MSWNSSNVTCISELEYSNRFLVSAVVYGLVLAVGLVLNTVSLWVLLRTHGLRTPCAVLMVNLAASDLLLALSLPLRVYYYATLKWPFGVATCTAALMLFRINIRTSCVFITLISVDRMVALVFPMRARSLRTTASASSCCAVVWILFTILSIPEIIKLHGALKPCQHVPCFEYQVHAAGSNTTALGQAIFLLLLLLVNIVSTVMVIVVLRKRPGGRSNRVHNKINVILIFFVNMLVFAIFFLPFALKLLIGDPDKEKGAATLRAFILLASINCCLDPLIYYFSLDSFWQDKSKKHTDMATYSLNKSLDVTG